MFLRYVLFLRYDTTHIHGTHTTETHKNIFKLKVPHIDNIKDLPTHKAQQ